MQAQTVWLQACQHLRTVLNADVFARWIAIIQPVRMEAEGHCLVVSVDNDFYQTWLEEHYLPLILDAVRAAGGPEDITLRFTIAPNPDTAGADRTPAAAPRKAVEQPMRRGSRRADVPRPALNNTFTFDNFIIGPSNSFAHAAATAVAKAPARAYNPLFMYGSTGLGKTHLMQAIGHCVCDNHARAVVHYRTSEALMNEYVGALQNRSLPAFRDKYRKSDVLLIDDIHFLAGKNALQEEFFHTFNALYDARRQIIMTSDRPASEIDGLEQRLVSRFEWGLVTEVESPDFETRLAILKYKQRQALQPLEDSLLYFIAENIRSNVRRLEGALVRAVYYASLTRKPLTVEALRHLLRDTLDQEAQDDLRFEDIQRTVAEHYDVRLTDMSSKRRPRSIAMPRQMAMYLCRRLTRASLPEIANAFGKTHATVLHACKAVHDRSQVEPDVRQHLNTLARKLGRDLTAL